MKPLLLAIALLLTSTTSALAAPPTPPDLPRDAIYVQHPYYGDTWLVHRPDGWVLAIPNVWSRWAWSYSEGARLTGTQQQRPWWFDQLGL